MIRNDPQNPGGIVWLASYPKSGNTWLRVYLYHLMRLMGGHPREEDELNKLDRASGYEAVLFGLFQQMIGKPLDQATPEEIMAVRPRVHELVAQRMKTVVLLKTHNLLGELGGMPTISPRVTAGAIYIVRDPRDVAPSLSLHLGCSIDDAIKAMRTSRFASASHREAAFELWGSWSEHVQSWTGEDAPTLLLIRYEDMLLKPTATFTAIAKHLRQSPTEDQIAEAIELSSFDKLKRQEEKGGFRERSERADRFFVSGKSGGWRDKLTSAQADQIAADHEAQMARFGYLN